jgi:hypothetical protein
VNVDRNGMSCSYLNRGGELMSTERDTELIKMAMEMDTMSRDYLRSPTNMTMQVIELLEAIKEKERGGDGVIQRDGEDTR